MQPFAHACSTDILSCIQVQCYAPLRQLYSDFGGFSNGGCRITDEGSYDWQNKSDYPDMGLYNSVEHLV